MRVRWTREAAADLEDVLSYIAERNPAAAAAVADRIEETITVIKQWPYAARQDKETGVREAVIRGLPLLVIYTINSLVEIIAVFHTSRNPATKRRRRR